METKVAYGPGSAMIRSMPMQFWPAEMNTPRSRMEAILGSCLVVEGSSRMMAASLPPSSTQTGVRDLAAEAQTA